MVSLTKASDSWVGDMLPLHEQGRERRARYAVYRPMVEESATVAHKVADGIWDNSLKSLSAWFGIVKG